MCLKKCRLYKAAEKRKKGKLWDAYRKLPDKTWNALRTDYVNGIISNGLAKGNHQPFWSYIKHQRQDVQSAAPLRVGSQLYVDSSLKAATLSEHNLNQYLPGIPQPLPTRDWILKLYAITKLR